jgi:hypothetical protein
MFIYARTNSDHEKLAVGVQTNHGVDRLQVGVSHVQMSVDEIHTGLDELRVSIFQIRVPLFAPCLN